MVQAALDDTTQEQLPPHLVFDAARLSGQADIPEQFLWPADESPTPNAAEDTSHNILRPWTHPAAEDRGLQIANRRTHPAANRPADVPLVRDLYSVHPAARMAWLGWRTARAGTAWWGRRCGRRRGGGRWRGRGRRRRGCGVIGRQGGCLRRGRCGAHRAPDKPPSGGGGRVDPT
jgi:hypothetical protein